MNNKLKIISTILAYFIMGSIFLLKWPSTLLSGGHHNYAILCISYFYVTGIFIYLYLKGKVEIFEPFTIFTVLYLLMYTVTPIVLIWNDNTLCWGTNVMGGCFKATLIYMISYTALYLGYFYKIKTVDKVNETDGFYHKKEAIDLTSSYHNKKKLLHWAYIMYVVFFLISLWFMLHCGYNIKYIFTLGIANTSLSEVSYSSLAFLENVIYGLIPLWLYICILSTNTAIKIITGFLPFAMFMIRGFRFVIVIQFLASIICYYRIKNKKPSIKVIILIVVIFMVMIAVVGFVRNSVRVGSDISWDDFGVDSINYSLYSNFNIYQIFYGLVNVMPQKVSFIYFKSMAESLKVFIPRVIWKSKPAADSVASIQTMIKCINDFVIHGAYMASPDLGSYYMSFGTIGCLIYSFIWGRVSRRMRIKNHINTNNIHGLISYSVYTIVIFYTITRGGDVFDILKKMMFFFVPISIMRFIERTKIQ
jgi:hypothetical protein